MQKLQNIAFTMFQNNALEIHRKVFINTGILYDINVQYWIGAKYNLEHILFFYDFFFASGCDHLLLVRNLRLYAFSHLENSYRGGFVSK